MTERVIIKVDSKKKDSIESHYLKFQKENKGDYIEFFAKADDVVVTVYSSNKKKDEFKVVFLGEKALENARIWDINAEVSKPKDKGPQEASWIILDDQIGSDEVGTGDFFGPISVTAAYVSKKMVKRLKELKVDDSKRLSDAQILQLGKILIKEVPYSQVSLNNEKFNELVDKGMNMNEMKVKMHNQVLKNLRNKFPEVKNFFVDEFLSADKYYAYLFGEEDIVDSITFKTKGESYYPCVAVASIISRYAFLEKMKNMEKTYGMEIPLGNNPRVKKVAIQIAKKYGVNELNKIVKKNFVTYDEVIQSI